MQVLSFIIFITFALGMFIGYVAGRRDALEDME